MSPAPNRRFQTLALMPPVTWAVPLVALVLLPALATGDTGTRLSFLFVELLFGLPLLVATPRPLKPYYLPMPVLPGLRAPAAYGAALLGIPAFQLCSHLLSLWLAPPEDVMVAMNGAPPRRLIDPSTDLASVGWSLAPRDWILRRDATPRAVAARRTPAHLPLAG